jgi:hypothetical protein
MHGHETFTLNVDTFSMSEKYECLLLYHPRTVLLPPFSPPFHHPFSPPQTETVLGPARDVATANAADIERAGGTWEARGLDWVYVL